MDEFGIPEEETLVRREETAIGKLTIFRVPKYGTTVSWFEKYWGGADRLSGTKEALKQDILESAKFRKEQQLLPKKVSLLEKELEEMRETVKLLSEKLLELEYAPSGTKAKEAGEHFERLNKYFTG
ncbi:hypothetical protein D1R32_gp471 [Tunisvirus fontaine2]|uniref:Uncharacterized protein n=1 Tax=Tunisvirus fontaine2 TaxID=1421067 RepID=V9SE49_9VIRU|nr:hypothetical protein D1R32_gp471 [Tunisvirus fontaine2]AHC55188.1 hypothetical protein TNS_ORF470 [Tunisvirus fontaine2]